MGERTLAQLTEMSEACRVWVRALGEAMERTVILRELAPDQRRSFDAFELDGAGIWVLHNRFVGAVGTVVGAPEPGDAWAVDQVFMPLPIPAHLNGWGPAVMSADELNTELLPEHWIDMSERARTYADRFSPTRVGHVLFNYWG